MSFDNGLFADLSSKIDKKLFAISFNNRKSFLYDYFLRLKNGELYLCDIQITNDEKACFMFFDKKSAEKIADLIVRLYDFDVVVEEV